MHIKVKDHQKPVKWLIITFVKRIILLISLSIITMLMNFFMNYLRFLWVSKMCFNQF
jgi:hypothetical protein